MPRARKKVPGAPKKVPGPPYSPRSPSYSPPGAAKKVPGAPKRVITNATSSRLTTLPNEILKKVLNQVSPKSTPRISAVNKSLRRMTKNGLGLRASVGDIVYNIDKWHTGMKLYKRDKSGELIELNPSIDTFAYYNQDEGKFVKPMRESNKEVARKKLGMKRLVTPTNIEILTEDEERPWLGYHVQ